jgi:hypothetical protein
MVSNRQAEARIHRIGQDASSVQIIDILTDGTIEDDVFENAQEKEAVLNEVTKDPAWVRRVLSRRERHMQQQTLPEVEMDGVTIVEAGKTTLAVELPGEPGENERRANRKERRDYIRTLPRGVRLAYGFGKVLRAPGGIFIPPAVPR